MPATEHLTDGIKRALRPLGHHDKVKAIKAINQAREADKQRIADLEAEVKKLKKTPKPAAPAKKAAAKAEPAKTDTKK